MKVSWIFFGVTERTWPYHKIYYFQFQRAITPKIRNPELWFLRSACRLMLLYICVKFHENISNSFWVTERIRFCDRQTDERTTRAKTICLPALKGGDIIMLWRLNLVTGTKTIMLWRHNLVTETKTIMFWRHNLVTATKTIMLWPHNLVMVNK